MVGFGYSLRMARRPCWDDGAYLDYEMLKLLLSQIEAVYEEEGLHRQKQQDKSRKRKTYQEELFLESDSDEAYLSVVEQQQQQGEESPAGAHRRHHSADEPPTPSHPFALHYSRESSSSSDEDAVDGCGTAVMASMPWSTKTNPENASKSRGRNSNNNALLLDDADLRGVASENNTARSKSHEEIIMDEEANAFYRHSGLSTTNAFILDDQEQQPFLLNAPGLRYEKQQQQQQQTSSGFFSFPNESGNMTPPSRFYARPIFEGDPPPYTTPLSLPSLGNNPPPPPQSTMDPTPLQRKLSLERQRHRRRRRRRQQQRRQNKVPLHLRVAHAKARAITARFLGLLRAETEKVMLFAQARLGELADTAGSLRFPANEDTPGDNNLYPLSDGGLHPSASSSSEDGTGGMWSDSSADENEQQQQQQQLQADGSSSHHHHVLHHQDSPSVDEFSMLLRNKASRRNVRSSPQVVSSRKRTGERQQQQQPPQRAKDRFRQATFQRSDHILGEDMMFLSAVEEADAYTAVGVELIHVLRYICVNLIAVRKICRKHDRLLMNRMLGGYYQRAKASHLEQETLGGLMTGVAGDDTHPVLVGQWNHLYKLVGVYDRKIQQLANSRPVQVVSSCLALALSEYEISRSRADALTNLNSSSTLRTPKRSGGQSSTAGLVVASSTKSDLDEPSTASEISLTRLQYTVTVIHALREAARVKQAPLSNYLSRASLSFSGQAVVGEGLDGCSRETLDVLVAYDPDAAVVLESTAIYEGLLRGQWSEATVRELMVASIATGLLPEIRSEGIPLQKALADEEAVLEYALRLNPGLPRKPLLQLLQKSPWNASSHSPRCGFTPMLLLVCRTASFLFMANYYIVHATCDIFVISTGASPVYTAFVIGAPNLTSLFISVVHSNVLSRVAHDTSRDAMKTFRLFFIVSAIFGCIGNLLHAKAVNKGSIPLAVLGRLIFGVSSTDILQREALRFCLPLHIASAGARLVVLQIAGVVTGLFLGALVETVEMSVDSFGVRSTQAGSWIFVVAWFLHFLRLLYQFKRDQVESEIDSNKEDNTDLNSAPEISGGPSDISSDVSSSSDEADRRDPSTLFGPSDSRDSGYQMSSYGSIVENENNDRNDGFAPLRKNGSMAETGVRKRRFRHLRVFSGRVRKLLSCHVGIPVSMSLVFFVSFGAESFFTSTSMLTHRYFGWSGAHACLFLGSLALAVVPIHFVCERISRRFEERTVIKGSIRLVMVGLFVMFNWVSAFSLAKRVPSLLSDTAERQVYHPYDWGFGVIQYVCGLSICFVGLTAMQGASLSLLSKVAPPTHLRSVAINVGTLTTFLVWASRLAADVQVLMVGLSHKLINADMVNSLAVPLFLVSLLVVFLVKRNYFFLI